MKNIISIIIMLALSTAISAQRISIDQIKLSAQDAINEMDSILVGDTWVYPYDEIRHEAVTINGNTYYQVLVNGIIADTTAVYYGTDEIDTLYFDGVPYTNGDDMYAQVMDTILSSIAANVIPSTFANTTSPGGDGVAGEHVGADGQGFLIGLDTVVTAGVDTVFTLTLGDESMSWCIPVKPVPGVMQAVDDTQLVSECNFTIDLLANDIVPDECQVAFVSVTSYPDGLTCFGVDALTGIVTCTGDIKNGCTCEPGDYVFEYEILSNNCPTVTATHTVTYEEPPAAESRVMLNEPDPATGISSGNSIIDTKDDGSTAPAGQEARRVVEWADAGQGNWSVMGTLTGQTGNNSWMTYTGDTPVVNAFLPYLTGTTGNFGIQKQSWADAEGYNERSILDAMDVNSSDDMTLFTNAKDIRIRTYWGGANSDCAESINTDNFDDLCSVTMGATSAMRFGISVLGSPPVGDIEINRIDVLKEQPLNGAISISATMSGGSTSYNGLPIMTTSTATSDRYEIEYTRTAGVNINELLHTNTRVNGLTAESVILMGDVGYDGGTGDSYAVVGSFAPNQFEGCGDFIGGRAMITARITEIATHTVTNPVWQIEGFNGTLGESPTLAQVFTNSGQLDYGGVGVFDLSASYIIDTNDGLKTVYTNWQEYINYAW